MSSIPMACPNCQSPQRRRLRRATLADRAWSALGLYPYQCLGCQRRYRSRRSRQEVPATGKRPGPWVVCPRCGGESSRRISGRDVTPTAGNFLWRKLGVPGYRCPDCRMRFHSLRKPKGSRV